MAEENLKEKIEKLKGLKIETDQQAARAAEENKKVTARANEILTSVKELEENLPLSLGQ